MAQPALLCAMTPGPCTAPIAALCVLAWNNLCYSLTEGTWWPGLAIPSLPTASSSKARRKNPPDFSFCCLERLCEAGAGGLLSPKPGCRAGPLMPGLDVAQHPQMLPQGVFQLQQLETEGFLAVPKGINLSRARDSSAKVARGAAGPAGSTGSPGTPRPTDAHSSPGAGDHPLLPQPPACARPFDVQLHCSSSSEV